MYIINVRCIIYTEIRATLKLKTSRNYYEYESGYLLLNTSLFTLKFLVLFKKAFYSSN